MGRAQQMMMEAALSPPPEGMPVVPGFNDPATMGRVRDFWSDLMALWQRFVDPAAEPSTPPSPTAGSRPNSGSRRSSTGSGKAIR